MRRWQDVSFQSLTRDSNHSNNRRECARRIVSGFNPSRGIAIIQTPLVTAFINACSPFQSLTRDSNHSNLAGEAVVRHANRGFNPSRGIAIIQTAGDAHALAQRDTFQSLTRDSNHSNLPLRDHARSTRGFNPSRGIAIIQTDSICAQGDAAHVSIPHAG